MKKICIVLWLRKPSRGVSLWCYDQMKDIYRLNSYEFTAQNNWLGLYWLICVDFCHILKCLYLVNSSCIYVYHVYIISFCSWLSHWYIQRVVFWAYDVQLLFFAHLELQKLNVPFISVQILTDSDVRFGLQPHKARSKFSCSFSFNMSKCKTLKIQIYPVTGDTKLCFVIFKNASLFCVFLHLQCCGSFCMKKNK